MDEQQNLSNKNALTQAFLGVWSYIHEFQPCFPTRGELKGELKDRELRVGKTRFLK
jgi:hypothetical protein